MRFLVVIGAAAGLASVFDFAWFITENQGWPPVGAVLSIVFLFLLAEALRQTGGALSDDERAWADDVLGTGRAAGTRPAA